MGVFLTIAVWPVPFCAAASPYATELIAHNGAFGGQTLYNDPNAVIGEPTRIAINNDPTIGTTPFQIKIVEPAYNRDLEGNKIITTLGRQPDGAGGYTYGSITVKFDHPIVDDPVNPYGIDLNVFGNSFYVGSGFVHDTTDMRSYNLVGGIFAEPVVISVSPDNVNWFTYSAGPFGDSAFPTQGYGWSAEQHDLTGNGWTNEATDFTKPINPTLNSLLGAIGLELATSDAIGAYVGSGGGTGIDLAESGFCAIQYVRVESTAQFRDGEIDAFADVRPMIVGDALAITPQNVLDGTPLYFQQPEAIAHTAVRADFTAVSDLAKLVTNLVTDDAALAALPAGDLLATYQLDVTALIGDSAIDFVADYRLSPGPDYSGNGADLDVLAWDGVAWNDVAFELDAASGLVLLDQWTAASATLAVLGPETALPGDFNRDGQVDAADYTVWRDGFPAQYDADDYLTWKSHFGESATTSGGIGAPAVPEPAAAVLLLTGLAAVLGQRRARA
jgi:hypothetical protein